MRRNERGISLIELVIAIVLMAVLVAVGVVLVLNKQDKKIEKEDSEKFLKDMKEVTYVNLQYGGKTIELATSAPLNTMSEKYVFEDINVSGVEWLEIRFSTPETYWNRFTGIVADAELN